MRGKDEQQLDVFSYISPEQRVPQDHPLRSLRAMTNEALQRLQPRFNSLYAKIGRSSIAPEKLLRALLLQALYSVRSERMLMEQLEYNLLLMVRGLEHGRLGLRRDGIHQEPRAPARRGHRRSLLPSCAPAGAAAKSAFGRALHSGWKRCWKPGRA
jgi:Transposase domain (DUF772)